MRKWMLIFAVLLAVFWSCDTSGGNYAAEDETEQTDDGENGDDETPEPTDGGDKTPEDPGEVEDPDLSDYESIDSAKSTTWIRYPRASRSAMYNIAIGDPDAALCNEPGWSYIFYDDGAIIGYEPFPDFIDLMQRAVQLTVEVHNQEYPESEWGYINVPMPYTPPDTSNDPVLGKWQFCLCLDDGTIVDGPYTAEEEWNWIKFKESIAMLQMELYNMEHDPDAHIVWGTDE